MVPIEVAPPLAGRLTTWQIELGSTALQRAGHVVLRTLYSRALRIGLDGASCSLRSLRKSVSLELSLVLVVRVLAYLAFELRILSKQQFERFADDIGRVCCNELGVSVQVVSDLFLQADLERCGLCLL